jgi:predicted aconitase with swiveling domain
VTGSVNVRSLVGGSAAGSPLVSRKAFTFAHGVDPSTGDVTDVHSDIEGGNVRGRILIYPYGKGSTTASAWFLETVRLGNAPQGIVTDAPDLAVVIGSVLAKVMYGRSIPVAASLPPESLDEVSGARSVRIEGGRLEIVT